MIHPTRRYSRTSKYSSDFQLAVLWVVVHFDLYYVLLCLSSLEEMKLDNAEQQKSSIYYYGYSFLMTHEGFSSICADACFSLDFYLSHKV